jgi:fatty acid desaturase
MRKDALAVSVIVPLHIGLSIYFGSFLGFLVSFFILERVGGALIQMRALAEHYGLWEVRATESAYRQALSARNIKAGWFFRWLFNDLCFHSIHHVYPSIPWYKLGEAHLTIPSFWEEFNPKAIEPKDTYGKIFTDGVRSWRLIDDRAH